MFPRDKLYAVNLALLLTHQVDAAYQREWEMIGVPGGIGFFLAFHFGVSLPLILAYGSVVKNSERARTAELALATLGWITVALHGLYLALGHQEFRQWGSLLILAAIALLSALQYSRVESAD